MNRRSIFSLAAFLLLLFPAASAQEPAREPAKDASDEPAGPWVITDRLFHLGNNDKPEWEEFTTAEPHHPSRLELEFGLLDPIRGPLTLELQSGGVSDPWMVEINGKEIGKLKTGQSLQTQRFEVDPALLKPEGNQLAIECDQKTDDDIYVGRAILHNLSIRGLLKFARVDIQVRDRQGEAIPCRLTVTRLQPLKDKVEETMAELEVEKDSRLALRRGVIYTLDGRARFEAPAGKYRIHATRGFEYGIAEATLELQPGARKPLDLVLEREVDTAGYLAADTHIHTKTYSGHGDASVEERVVTIAGEGIEVAIATDHNHHTDYRPVAEKIGGADGYLPVIGNEFTASLGHFNGFPIEKGARPADHTHKDWAKLIQALRATPGVRVVICNHPRRGKIQESAFGKIGLSPVSGEAFQGPPSLGVDAVEVINGNTLHDDPMTTFRDWFALLNRGHRAAAVGGSDSHTVEGIVGQVRTYVRSSVDDPRRADVVEIAESFLAGRALVSVGLLADVVVNGRYGVGDLAGGIGEEIEARITVSGPRWTRADRVALYLNGDRVREERIEHAADAIVKYQEVWKIPAPRRDAHLVVIATGPAVQTPYWAQSEDKWKYVLGATNPVWIDGDGDGRFTSAYEYAARLVEEHRDRPDRLRDSLAGHDDAVWVQSASILRARLRDELQAEYERLREGYERRLDGFLAAAGSTLAGPFQEYLDAAPPLDVIRYTDRRERELEEKRDQEEREKKERERIAKEKEKAKAKPSAAKDAAGDKKASETPAKRRVEDLRE